MGIFCVDGQNQNRIEGNKIVQDLPDIQNEPDTRGIEIKHAGIRNLRFPFIVRDQINILQHVTGTFTIMTGLKAEQKGVHMSLLLLELKEVAGKQVNLEYLQDSLLPRVLKSQQANNGSIKVTFDYFVPVTAPASRIKSTLPVKASLTASTYHRPVLSATTPVMAVCPCSLALCDGQHAHNQRAYIEVSVQSNRFIWIESLVRASWKAASSPVYPILKRVDEKYVTEAAHKRPRFVEDLVRETLIEVRLAQLIYRWMRITAETEESIHAHNAFAEVEDGVFK